MVISSLLHDCSLFSLLTTSYTLEEEGWLSILPAQEQRLAWSGLPHLPLPRHGCCALYEAGAAHRPPWHLTFLKYRTWKLCRFGNLWGDLASIQVAKTVSLIEWLRRYVEVVNANSREGFQCSIFKFVVVTGVGCVRARRQQHTRANPTVPRLFFLQAT